MITIVNDGQELVSSDYWSTEQARSGFMYLSGNAGAWRLLVPDSAASYISEMQGAESVSIEESIQAPGVAWDIVFEDGSDTPLCVSIDKRQCDRAMTPGFAVFSVWLARGKAMELPCTVRVGASGNGMA